MTKLQNGNMAPSIDRTTVFGRRVATDHMMDSKIWIAFYRYSSCPMCDMHFDDVITRFSELEKAGVKFIAIFESDLEAFPKRITGLANKEFNVIADKNKLLYDAYRIEVSWPKLLSPGTIREAVRAEMKGYRPGTIDGKLARIPAHFLVYKGVIFQAHYGNHAGHHISWSTVLDFGKAQLEDPAIEL